MPDLSVIVAFVNEYPQLIFTIRSIVEELRGRVDFEIIAVNNFCREVEDQGRKEDGGAGALIAASEGNPWLRVLKYDTKLSHWQAKNLGVKEAASDTFWFPDAHVVPSRDSVVKAFKFYKKNLERLNGTLHLPLTYQILEWNRLTYGLIADPEKNAYFYQFTPYNPVGLKHGEKIIGRKGELLAYEVPVMSTCGCFMNRTVYDKLGGWPEEIGIYGGGEPFVNFSQAVMGMKKWIMVGDPLYHHGTERGYSWNHDGWFRDELIAAYCYGGREFAHKKMRNMDGHPGVKQRLLDSVQHNASIKRHREHIESQQVMSIEEWVQPWLS